MTIITVGAIVLVGETVSDQRDSLRDYVIVIQTGCRVPITQSLSCQGRVFYFVQVKWVCGEISDLSADCGSTALVVGENNVEEVLQLRDGKKFIDNGLSPVFTESGPVFAYLQRANDLFGAPFKVPLVIVS